MANLKVDPLKMANSQIDPSCYILKFRKYKQMLAVDVVDIQIVNKKGEYENIGLKYLQFLCKQDWFKQVDIVQSIIEDYLQEKDVGDVPELKTEETEPKKRKAKVKKSELTVFHD